MSTQLTATGRDSTRAGPAQDSENLDCLCCANGPATIVHAALGAFAAFDGPDAMSSADLASCLRDLPGVAEGRWPYVSLTQVRLARLLAPYGVRTRSVTFRGGRRFKAYRRRDLQAARAECSC